MRRRPVVTDRGTRATPARSDGDAKRGVLDDDEEGTSVAATSNNKEQRPQAILSFSSFLLPSLEIFWLHCVSACICFA